MAFQISLSVRKKTQAGSSNEYPVRAQWVANERGVPSMDPSSSFDLHSQLVSPLLVSSYHVLVTLRLLRLKSQSGSDTASPCLFGPSLVGLVGT